MANLSIKKSGISPLTGEWLKKAQDDELAAELLLREKISYSVVCFLSQQIAEKCLKAYLCEHSIEFPKVRHLERLISLCANPEFKRLGEEAVLLSEYYIETRYPGDWLEGFTRQDANKAFMAAMKIKNLVFEKLGM